MSVFAGGREPPPLDPVPTEPPEAVSAFTRAEHMAGEEHALLQVLEADRTPEQRARLRALADELDRIRDLLRRREKALGRA